MSTRCNIVIDHGGTRVYIYRHCDGYPAETGADIVAKLRNEFGTASPSRFLQALLDERYEKQSYETTARAVYEVTTEVHGDVDYVYGVKYTEGEGCFVACLAFRPGSERRAPVAGEFGGINHLITRVNQDRAEINARMDARKIDGERYTLFPTDEPSVRCVCSQCKREVFARASQSYCVCGGLLEVDA